jgi:diadenylate cyclase
MMPCGLQVYWKNAERLDKVMWTGIPSFGFGDIIQILALTFAFYYLFLFFRGTRGAQVLVGLVFLLAFLIGFTQLFNLNELNWVLRRIFLFLGVALLIIFQPEIRRALAELGRQPAFSASVAQRSAVDNVVQTVIMLAEHRIGALIAVEREIGTRAIQETGIKLDVKLHPDLLSSMFYPHTPLHDGGVIIRGNRIIAAKCVFPLSQNVELHKSIGTRHRAAVGLTEETDAVVVIVSEETGTISVSYRGRLSRGLDEERLKRFLAALLLKGKGAESAWKRAQEQLDLTPEGIAKSETLAEQEKSSSE